MYVADWEHEDDPGITMRLQIASRSAPLRKEVRAFILPFGVSTESEHVVWKNGWAAIITRTYVTRGTHMEMSPFFPWLLLSLREKWHHCSWMKTSQYPKKNVILVVSSLYWAISHFNCLNSLFYVEPYLGIGTTGNVSRHGRMLGSRFRRFTFSILNPLWNQPGKNVEKMITFAVKRRSLIQMQQKSNQW